MCIITFLKHKIGKFFKIDYFQDLVCPWIDLDPEAIPELELPPSSQDIPLPAEHILDVVEVGEILNFRKK